jgi:acyl-CoA thioester hydrolase
MHEFSLRVYYEDVDLAGIVYYANYLRFIARGRTEALLACGVDQAAIRAATGVVFAVRRIEADYIAPARFQDRLVVRTTLASLGGARAELDQEVRRDGTTLMRARVGVVALAVDGRPARLPAEARAALERLGTGARLGPAPEAGPVAGDP